MSDLQDELDRHEAAHWNNRLTKGSFIVRAARKLANPTDQDLERLFLPLLNFRKWVKNTDEITDHDLLVTARRVVAALDVTKGE